MRWKRVKRNTNVIFLFDKIFIHLSLLEKAMYFLLYCKNILLKKIKIKKNQQIRRIEKWKNVSLNCLLDIFQRKVIFISNLIFILFIGTLEQK